MDPVAAPTRCAALARAAGRALAGLLLALQVLAPWLHAHLATARTVGFHMHVAAVELHPGVPPGSSAPSFDVLLPGDEPSIGMPASWLRHGGTIDDPGAPAGIAPAAVARPVAAPALVQRVRAQDAPRPPPPVALVAYAAHAPPAATSLPTRG